ncbi:MAG: hypothetical protein NVS3B26_14550 [Mycobacteriales bacterium]
MERRRSDLPVYLGALAALAVTGGIIYAAVDAATVGAAVDSNTPNGTTQGPPASFQKP